MPHFLDVPPTPQDRAMLAVAVLAAVSGGGDSVAMLRRLDRVHREIESPAELRVVHFNHRLRGPASDADEAFVRSLAEGLNRPIHVGSPPPDESRTDEQSLRNLRRRFNDCVAAATGARVIATGHTADDVTETVLHHLLRGTGPRGLVGPSRVAPAGRLTLWRPMIAWTGRQLRADLEAIGQPYRTDDSNADLTYTRNWIRHAVRPLLAQRFPGSDAAIAGLAGRQSELMAMVDRLAGRWVDRFTQTHAGIIQIAELPPQNMDVTWQREPTVIQAAVHQTATAAGWSLSCWRANHYERLVQQIISRTDQTWTLPGAIEVRPRNRTIWLEKKEI